VSCNNKVISQFKRRLTARFYRLEEKWEAEK